MSRLLYVILFHILVVVWILANEECQLQPEFISSQNKNIDKSYLYFYIPINSIGVVQNSIGIYNEDAKLLDCLNMKDFKEENDISSEQPSFFTIKYITDNTYVINYVRSDNDIAVSSNFAHWYIIDDFFNIKKEYPILEMSPSIESSLFESNAFVNLHDIVITEDLKYSIMLVMEYQTVTDINTHFPGSLLESALISFDGLCAIDLKTGKEVAALSGNDIFIDLDHWWKYVSHYDESSFYVENPYNNDIYNAIYLTHISSMVLVNGGHFSNNLSNEDLFLASLKTYEVFSLFRWDYLNKHPENKSYEIIWNLPGANSIEPIKNTWSNKWEILNDPLIAPSSSHDLNVINAPKGHILFFDNGVSHQVSDSSEYTCQMSRGVEYKIEMDVDGQREGKKHRATLVFSYPSVSDYPENIYFENEPIFDKEKCEDFWIKYNFQGVIGSFRKTKIGDYVITRYPYDVLHMDLKPLSSRMIKVNKNGEIVNVWGALDDISISFRVVPVRSDLFRNGNYLSNDSIIRLDKNIISI